MNKQEVIGRLCRLVKERERDMRVAQTRRMRKSEKAMTLSSYVMDIEALKMAIVAVEHREFITVGSISARMTREKS